MCQFECLLQGVQVVCAMEDRPHDPVEEDSAGVLFAGCLASQQHANVSLGRIGSDNLRDAIVR